MEEKIYVNYEDFGAVGDGEHDDMAAIVAAHAYANAHGLPVKTRRDATYYIGPGANPAYVETDVDWNTSRFTIDDRAVENNKVPIFMVRSTLAETTLPITRLTRGTKKLDIHPERDMLVTVYNDNVRHFIRLGPNQSAGEPALDTFVLKTDGTIYGNIDWDHEIVTRVVARPIDEKTLMLKGGYFTTIANREASTYNYYGRNIEIQRSRVTVDSVVHYVAGEISHGAPYRGFVSGVNCAYFTVKNSFFTGHKIYQTIGAAGVPVMMGSYDLHANNVVDFYCENCRINGITDNTRWGVIASNFCKNIVVENCVFSRLDAHMGVSGEYTIRNSQLGHQGLNAIGKGKLTLENTTLYGARFLNFRDDYGSNWEGDVEIKNCRWVPNGGEECTPILIHSTNNGMHDFGYPCSMPEHIVIDGLVVADINTPEGYPGLQLLKNPDEGAWKEKADPADLGPFPYKRAKSVEVTGLVCESGKPAFVCDDPNAFPDTVITVNGEKLN
ncbi:MAG: hypothetical protein IJB51_00405 [Clostridia bacterium]|nr:hypothetical protein [Clostridia bacterium]